MSNRKLADLKRAEPELIKLPTSKENGKLVLLLGDDDSLLESLKEQFLNLGFAIVGPITSSDHAHNVARRIPVDGFIYQLGTNLQEILAFFSMLEDFPNHPVVFIGQADATIKMKQKKLRNPFTTITFPPVDKVKFFKKLMSVFKVEDEGINDHLRFTNLLFIEIINLSRRRERSEMERLIIDQINQLPNRWQEYSIIESPFPYLTMKPGHIFDKNSFVGVLEVFLLELEETIDNSLKVDWGKDLVNDAILQVLAKHHFDDPDVKIIAERRGLNIKTTDDMVDEVIKSSGNVSIGFIALEDHGPELIKYVGDLNKDELFTEQVVAQMISVIGQGESYREGQFGVIPLLTTADYVAVLASRRLESSSLTDERMGGYSLTLLAIVVPKSSANLLMEKNFQQELMSEFRAATEVEDITDEVLNSMYKKVKFVVAPM